MIVAMDSVDPAAVPVRPAATVVVVEEGPAGPRVLMMRRNVRGDFVGGAHVFPGGGVDPTDDDRLIASWFPDLDPRSVPHRVAAVREVFEESGVVLAVDASGSWPDPATSGGRRVLEEWAAARRSVESGELGLAELCSGTGVRPALDGLTPIARWVTPVGAHRRYDTWFFLTPSPPGQEATCDEVEVTTAEWWRPAEALERNREGRITLIFPTLRTLVDLSPHESVSAMVGALGSPEPRPVVPEILTTDAGPVVVMPDGRRFDATGGHELVPR